MKVYQYSFIYITHPDWSLTNQASRSSLPQCIISLTEYY
jgi:hypothetical protein